MGMRFFRPLISLTVRLLFVIGSSKILLSHLSGIDFPLIDQGEIEAPNENGKK